MIEGTQSRFLEGSVVRALRFVSLRRHVFDVNGPLFLSVNNIHESVVRTTDCDHFASTRGLVERSDSRARKFSSFIELLLRSGYECGAIKLRLPVLAG